MAFILLFKSHFTVLVNYLLVQWTQLDEYCTLGSNYRLMIISVKFKKIRFVIVKNFWSNSNQLLVILIRSSELASVKRAQKTFRIHNSGCGSVMKHSSLVLLPCRIKQKYGKRGHCVKI